MEMIPTPLDVPTTRQQINTPQQPRPVFPPHSSALHAVRKPAMKSGRRHGSAPIFRVYRADPWEFRHLVQRLTGAPQLSQAAQTSQRDIALPPGMALVPTPVSGLPTYHHSVQLQGDNTASLESAVHINIAPYMLQNMTTELTFEDDVVTSGVGGLVPEAYGAVPLSQAAMDDSTGAAEFWLTALYPEGTVWSSLPTVICPEAIASMDHI